MRKSGLQTGAVHKNIEDANSGSLEAYDSGLMLLNPGHITDHALRDLYPSPVQAQVLWQTYLDNVHPLCKILHAPSFQKVIESARSSFQGTSKSNVALLFSVYTFALFTITNADSERKLGQPRGGLLKRLIHGTQQALYASLRTPNFITFGAIFKC
jgi:hypothetical protein